MASVVTSVESTRTLVVVNLFEVESSSEVFQVL